MNKNQEIALRVAAAVVLTPIGAIVGVATMVGLERLSKGKLSAKLFRFAESLDEKTDESRARRRKARQEKFTVAEYNEAVTNYNASVIYFNKIVEEKMDDVPKLKELKDMVDQEEFDLQFDEIMRKEF